MEEKLGGFKAVKCLWCVSMFPNTILLSSRTLPTVFKATELGILLFKPYSSGLYGIDILFGKPKLREEECLPLLLSTQVFIYLSCTACGSILLCPVSGCEKNSLSL